MLTFTITGQVLKVSTPTIAADTINYLTARFEFSADWNGLVKIARFSNDTEGAEVELTDDEIREEAGLNLTAGYWRVSLTGHEMIGGEMVKRITTTRAYFRVLPSGVPDGEPLPSLPSYGEEILAKVTDIDDKFGTFTAEAETLVPESDATASYDPATGVFTFGIPRGDKGEPGRDAPVITDTATGAVASFPDGADGWPMRSLVVGIEPVQAGSGDPSPDNVRPISGWTGAHVTISPTQNAEDGTTYSIAFPSEAGTVYGGTLDVTNGVLTVDKGFITFDGSNDEAWYLKRRSILDGDKWKTSRFKNINVQRVQKC